MVYGGGRRDRRMDGRTDGCLESPPCVLQDIGPLGLLPKKEAETRRGYERGSEGVERRAGGN